MVFQLGLINPPIRTKETKKAAHKVTTAPEISNNTSSLLSKSTSTKSSKFKLFRKKPTPPPTLEEEQKTKEMIMKYRNMTSEEADAYLEEKKNEKDGMGAERGLRALGMALAPVRL